MKIWIWGLNALKTLLTRFRENPSAGSKDFKGWDRRTQTIYEKILIGGRIIVTAGFHPTVTKIARSNEIRETNFLHIRFEANLCCRYCAAAAAALPAENCIVPHLFHWLSCYSTAVKHFPKIWSIGNKNCFLLCHAKLFRFRTRSDLGTPTLGPGGKLRFSPILLPQELIF